MHKRLQTLVLLAVWGFSAEVLFAQNKAQPASFETLGVQALLNEAPDLTGLSVSIGLVELDQNTASSTDSSFLPNFEHAALSAIDLESIRCFRNLQGPVYYSGHASRIAGILFGRDDQAYHEELGHFAYRGILPSATLNMYEANWFIFQRIFQPDQHVIDDDILTMSWGTNADDPVTLLWQRSIDALVVRNQCLVVSGSGNGSSQETGIAKPSAGFNIISVGAAQGLGPIPDYLRYVGPPSPNQSSIGPTDDGRTKPDIIAPGLVLGPSASDAESYAEPRASVSCTSFAAPQVAGIAGLLLDAARYEGWLDAEDPRVMKALLLNGADKLTGWHKGQVGQADDSAVPLDYAQGAGLVNAYHSWDHLQAGQYDPDLIQRNCGWDLSRVALDPNDGESVQVYVLPQPVESGDDVKATLTWYRHFGEDRFVSEEPLMHLGLELWRRDDASNLLELLDDSASPTDNLQHIYYQNETPQKMALVVRLMEKDTPREGAETYGLAFCADQVNWDGDLLAADFNQNGAVDSQDMYHLFREMLQGHEDILKFIPAVSDMTRSPDLNFDGQVDVMDSQLFLEQLGQESLWHEQPEE